MQIEIVNTVKGYTSHIPHPTKVAHTFFRKNENRSVYICGVYIGSEPDSAMVVPRFGNTVQFSAFLKVTKTESVYKKYIQFLKNCKSVQEFLASGEFLLKNFQLVFELQNIDNLIHALDFRDTEEFNNEARGIDSSILAMTDTLTNPTVEE